MIEIEKARQKYYSQKSAAKQRDIEWDITFDSWVKVWVSSGRWEQRGRGFGRYCMSRKGDTGPYSEDNVVIVTNGQNWINSTGYKSGTRASNNKGLPPLVTEQQARELVHELMIHKRAEISATLKE